jgi:prepilin-type N-terminal cleavage/methylation domain-containing protein
MTAQSFKTNKGFTLIELLVVIGILAILLAITLIAINPARQFGQANDANRRSAVTQILNAVGQYSASNSGNLPTDLADIALLPQNNVAVILNRANFPTLCGQLVPTYLPSIPVDPSANDQNGIEAADCTAIQWTTAGPTSAYAIARDANNRITVSATAPYAGPIQVTR